MMDVFRALVGERGEGVGVPRVEGGIHPGGDCGRAVRSDAAANPTRPPGRELVEAGEGHVLAVRIEQLVACYEAVASKEPEQEERPLEGTAAGTRRADVRQAQQQRVKSQSKDVVDPRGDVVRNLEQGAKLVQVFR